MLFLKCVLGMWSGLVDCLVCFVAVYVCLDGMDGWMDAYKCICIDATVERIIFLWWSFSWA